MNDTARRIIMDKRRRDMARYDMAGGDYARSNRGGRRGRDYADYGRGGYQGTMEYGGDYAERDYAYDGADYERDGRRGVKGTGPYGIGGRRYYGRRRRDYAMDGDYDDEEDYADHAPMKLEKKDMQEWKRKIMNADGTRGEHFDLMQIKQAAQSLGLQMRGYDEKELCMAANMLYSDYCDVLKQFIPKDKEAMFYVKMAKAFFEDADFDGEGAEKLAIYYHCVVAEDEE